MLIKTFDCCPIALTAAITSRDSAAHKIPMKAIKQASQTHHNLCSYDSVEGCAKQACKVCGMCC